MLAVCALTAETGALWTAWTTVLQSADERDSWANREEEKKTRWVTTGISTDWDRAELDSEQDWVQVSHTHAHLHNVLLTLLLYHLLALWMMVSGPADIPVQRRCAWEFLSAEEMHIFQEKVCLPGGGLQPKILTTTSSVFFFLAFIILIKIIEKEKEENENKYRASCDNISPPLLVSSNHSAALAGCSSHSGFIGRLWRHESQHRCSLNL